MVVQAKKRGAGFLSVHGDQGFWVSPCVPGNLDADLPWHLQATLAVAH